METDAAGLDLGGTQEHARLMATPDVCPRCGRGVHPKLVAMAKLSERALGQAVFRCTHQSCQEIFLANYKFMNRSEGGRMAYGLVSVAPVKAKAPVFPGTIGEISPQFVAIYSQAIEAEALELDQIVGLGFRKALEFLVKDYAIAEHPDRAEQIRKMQLAQCIGDLISDTNIKECSKRAAWLGNDEAHYTRRWETKDIGDLKLLVHLTVNWIDNALLTKQYIASMPPNVA